MIRKCSCVSFANLLRIGSFDAFKDGKNSESINWWEYVSNRSLRYRLETISYCNSEDVNSESMEFFLPRAEIEPKFELWEYLVNMIWNSFECLVSLFWSFPDYGCIKSFNLSRASSILEVSVFYCLTSFSAKTWITFLTSIDVSKSVNLPVSSCDSSSLWAANMSCVS